MGLRRLALFLVLSLAACSGSSVEFGSATLTWEPVGDADVVGYNVYRLEPHDDDFRKVNSDLVREPRYVDTTVVRGKTYRYALTAVTAIGVESDLSEPASKTID